MKNLLFVVLSVFAMQAVHAQSNIAKNGNVAIVQSTKDFQAQELKDIFTFTVSKDITAEQVKYQSAFYTDYFTVQFNEATHQLTFKMNDQDLKKRNIMRRMFAGLEVESVQFDGIFYTVDDFFQKHIYRLEQSTK